MGDCSEYMEGVMGFSLGTWDTCKVSRCIGGRGSAVRINPEAHNDLVFLKDVACVLSISHDTNGDTELWKECPPLRLYPYEIGVKKWGTAA